MVTAYGSIDLTRLPWWFHHSSFFVKTPRPSTNLGRLNGATTDPTIIPASVTEKVLFQKRVAEYLERAERNRLRSHPDVKMIDKANLFWLKDSWRASSNLSEICFYRKLKAKGIPNPPETFYAGDICDGPILQSILKDSVHSEGNYPWSRPTKPIRHMIHHRIP